MQRQQGGGCAVQLQSLLLHSSSQFVRRLCTASSRSSAYTRTINCQKTPPHDDGFSIFQGFLV